MELEDLKMMSSNNKEEVVVDEKEEEEEEEEEGRLPGFRFHPTDEELVTFYLKRKVEKRRISIEIIKQIDIYKHDPWDLAKASSVGDKEWYFYCRRERKYRNSVRPNRVTGSGFWKATGIDKPIYSNIVGEGHQCVGLKKSLVYYRGSAGKGTKTDWMMHEFRLPIDHQNSSGSNHIDTLEEAEVWTLCRILKRNRKYSPDWRKVSNKRTAAVTNSSVLSSKACKSAESMNKQERYISFVNATTQQQRQPKYEATNYSDYSTHLKSTDIARQNIEESDTKGMIYLTSTRNDIAGPSIAHASASDASNFSSPLNPSSSVEDQGGQFLAGYGGNWDDLSSVVEFAIRTPLL